MWNRVQVVRVVERQRLGHPLSDTERREAEFLSLLEQPSLTPRKFERLMSLFDQLKQKLSPEQMQALLATPSRSELGCMTLPRSCRTRPSRFDAIDAGASDPCTLLPIISESGNEFPEPQALLEKNASGHGIRLIHIARRHEELPLEGMVETSDLTRPLMS